MKPYLSESILKDFEKFLTDLKGFLLNPLSSAKKEALVIDLHRLIKNIDREMKSPALLGLEKDLHFLKNKDLFSPINRDEIALFVDEMSDKFLNLKNKGYYQR